MFPDQPKYIIRAVAVEFYMLGWWVDSHMAVRQFARTLCHLVRGPAAPHKVGVHNVGVHKVGSTRR